jgi:hypothetical protein
VAEAQGVLRDVLAALRNLLHLLRSPRVGAKALGQVIPGLRDLCGPLSASADDVRTHLGAVLSEVGDEDAVADLSGFVRDASSRLSGVLDWASAADMDAKSRLSFEAQIDRMAAELGTARRLLDLLCRSAERADTELDVAEVIQASIAASMRGDQLRADATQVVVAMSDGAALSASAHVIAPLVAFGIALVRRGPGDTVGVTAAAAAPGTVSITISRGPLEGDVHVFQPPLVVAPVLACAKAAARLGGGRFAFSDGTVRITWPFFPSS